MRIRIILTALIMTSNLYAQGCIIGGQPSHPRYVCFDGRSLEASPTGLVWNAKRGCFLSSTPCCSYNAVHYAHYPNNPDKIGAAYSRCRHDYPFELGQMQTH